MKKRLSDLLIYWTFFKYSKSNEIINIRLCQTHTHSHKLLTTWYRVVNERKNEVPRWNFSVCVYVHVKTNGSKKKTKPTPALGYSVAHWVQSRCVNRIYGIYKPFRGSALKRNIQVERQQQQQQQKRNKTNENNISSEQEKCAPRSLLFFALQFTFFIMHIFEQVASLS